MVRDLSEVEGMVTSEGTIYPLLSRLRRDGLVSTSWRESASGPPRRYYELTAAGESGTGVLHPSMEYVQRRCRSPAGREGHDLMMTAPTGTADAAIADYLDDLRDILAPLPRERRRELVRDLGVHIGTTRAELHDPFSEAEVRNLLERLGTPEEIAEAEGVGEPVAVAAPASVESSWREPAAIVLLLLGGFVAAVGWMAGLILLWSSPRWSVRDKLIGTFVLPGGLAASVTVAAYVLSRQILPASHGSVGSHLLLIAVAVLPPASAAWLALRLRRDGRA